MVIRWFQPLRLKSYAERVLTLHHDQSIYGYWIEENYLQQLTVTASRVLGESVSISFHSEEPAAAPQAVSAPSKTELVSKASVVPVFAGHGYKAAQPEVNANPASWSKPAPQFDQLILMS